MYFDQRAEGEISDYSLESCEKRDCIVLCTYDNTCDIFLGHVCVCVCVFLET